MEYSKVQAAAYLGVGLKMIEKLLAKGRLKGRLRTGTLGPEQVFSQAELDHLKAELKPETTLVPVKLASDSQALAAPLEPPLFTPEDFVGMFFEHVPIADLLTLSIRQAAQLSGLPVSLLREAIRNQKLPAKLFGRGWRIRREDLRSYIGQLWDEGKKDDSAKSEKVKKKHKR